MGVHVGVTSFPATSTTMFEKVMLPFGGNCVHLNLQRVWARAAVPASQTGTDTRVLVLQSPRRRWRRPARLAPRGKACAPGQDVRFACMAKRATYGACSTTMKAVVSGTFCLASNW